MAKKSLITNTATINNPKLAAYIITENTRYIPYIKEPKKQKGETNVSR